MKYNIVFHIEAKKDIEKLDNTLKILVFKQIKKLIDKPEIGQPLGNKAGFDLSNYRKIYACKKKIRIVYKVIENRIEIFIIAIEKRDKMSVYNIAASRK